LLRRKLFRPFTHARRCFHQKRTIGTILQLGGNGEGYLRRGVE
jgi:hypothetical protein